MDLQKINVKFYVAESGGIHPPEFISIFNSWIQDSDGVYYDLADYSHVSEGPGILLIAHEANVSIDNGEGRLGLLYNQKRRMEGTNDEKLSSVFRAAIGYCRKLEKEPKVNGRLKFRGDEALVVINDRLATPNAPGTFLASKDNLDRLAHRLFGGNDFTLQERKEDPRRRFAVTLKSRAPLDITFLERNLNCIQA